MLRGILLVILLCWVGAAAQAQSIADLSSRSIPLWPNGVPADSGTAPQGAERTSHSGAVSNIGQPRLVIYRPAQPNGAAVLVIGGGGYYQIGIGHEADPAARWLATLGVTSAVLYYRLPADGWKAVAPFQDGQRAMRILRAQATVLGLDARRIGVLGFSAGGHLAGILATRSDDAFYAPMDATDRQSAHPDFAALIYPVTSLRPPYDTTRAAHELSTQPDAATAYTVSVHVTHATPPSFIAHAADDPIANVGASLELFDVLRKQQVPAELHVFEQGGHGWGMGQAGTLVAAWPQLFASWAQAHGFFSAGTAAAPAAPARRHGAARKRDQ
jgi:acetyl esterase/lipase